MYKIYKILINKKELFIFCKKIHSFGPNWSECSYTNGG